MQSKLEGDAMSDNSSRPRGVPPKPTKTGVPPKLGALRKPESLNDAPKPQPERLPRESIPRPAPRVPESRELESREPEPQLPESELVQTIELEDSEPTPVAAPGLRPAMVRAGARALPSRGSLIGGGGIIGAQGKLKAERKRSQWPLLGFTLAVLTALVVVPFLILRPQESVYVLRQFTAASVTRGTIEETVSSPGTIVPKDVIDVISKAAATVQSLLVKEGQDVAGGQVLAKLVSPDLEKAAREAKNALTKSEDELAQARLQAVQSERDAGAKLNDAQAGVNDLERALSRVKELFVIGAEAKVTVDAARDKLTLAQREISSLERALSDARSSGGLKISAAERALKNAGDDLKRSIANLEDLQVKAPFAGRIVGLSVRAGQDVPISNKILTLADVSQLIVEGNVDATSAGRVQPGQAVRVTVGDKPIEGKVSRVASQAVTGSNGATVKVEVRLFPKDERDSKGNSIASPIRPNSGAGLEITVGRKKDVPTLPRGAFITTGGERIAFVVSQDGVKAKRNEVTFGASNADLIEVTSGLKDGDRVITSSVEAFKDRTEIEVSKGGEIK
jgi:HlyD family secretion protein